MKYEGIVIAVGCVALAIFAVLVSCLFALQ